MEQIQNYNLDENVLDLNYGTRNEQIIMEQTIDVGLSMDAENNERLTTESLSEVPPIFEMDVTSESMSLSFANLFEMIETSDMPPTAITQNWFAT